MGQKQCIVCEKTAAVLGASHYYNISSRLLLRSKFHDGEPLEVDDELEVGRVREQVDWDDALRDERIALIHVGRQLPQVHEVLHRGLRVAADVDQALNAG